jgi:hypothetical protein
MPTFEITSPDGAIYHVDAPEGASEQDALAHLQQHLGATPEPSVAADVAKSLGRGIAKGAIGLAGLPGDMATLLNKGEDYVIGKLGFEPPPTQPIGTSQQIEGLVEKASGQKFGEPQTTAGKYAQTVGEFVPAAIGGPEGIATRLGTRAVLPGIASEAAGEATEGSPYEVPARIAGAVLGGGAGIGATKAGQAVSNYGAARSAAKEIGPDINAGAVNRMAKSFEADELTPQRVQQRADQLGPEAMTMDMGRQMQGRAEAIASQPGKGQNAVLDAIEQRVHGLDQFDRVQSQFGQETANRIKNTLDTELGPSHDKVALLNTVSDIVDQSAKPLYQKVMDSHPVVDVPAEITSRPAVKSAMGNAVELAKNYGEKLEGPAETKTILQGPGYHIAEDTKPQAQTSLRYWDYVKKDLDRRINDYYKSGGASELSSKDKADLGGLIDARRALVNHLDTVTNGEYANARRAWSFKPQLTDAYQTGRDAFNTKLLPEEFTEQVSNMSLPEQAMARAGYRRELERVIDTARNDGAAARRLLDTNSNLAKTEALFGTPARRAIEDRIAAETMFQTAANRIAGNSRTAVKSQLAKDTESPSEAAPPVATSLGYLHKGLGAGLNYARTQGMENTREAIGRMSTMKGPELRKLADVLANYNVQRAANTRPVVPQLGGLARVLAASPSYRPAVQEIPVARRADASQ